MPPWLPEPGEWKFSDDLHLSPEEIRFFKNGCKTHPEGSPSDLPLRRISIPDATRPADLILRADSPLKFRQRSDVYWNFIFRVPLEKTRWIKAIEIPRASAASSITQISSWIARNLRVVRKNSPAAVSQAWNCKLNPNPSIRRPFLLLKPEQSSSPEPPGCFAS